MTQESITANLVKCPNCGLTFYLASKVAVLCLGENCKCMIDPEIHRVVKEEVPQ